MVPAEFPAPYLEAGAIPLLLADFGAGTRYHIAILSPDGLTPMVVFEPMRGDAAAIAAEIAAVFEQLLSAWR